MKRGDQTAKAKRDYARAIERERRAVDALDAIPKGPKLDRAQKRARQLADETNAALARLEEARLSDGEPKLAPAKYTPTVVPFDVIPEARQRQLMKRAIENIDRALAEPVNHVLRETLTENRANAVRVLEQLDAMKLHKVHPSEARMAEEILLGAPKQKKAKKPARRRSGADAADFAKDHEIINAVSKDRAHRMWGGRLVGVYGPKDASKKKRPRQAYVLAAWDTPDGSAWLTVQTPTGARWIVRPWQVGELPPTHRPRSSDAAMRAELAAQRRRARKAGAQGAAAAARRDGAAEARAVQDEERDERIAEAMLFPVGTTVDVYANLLKRGTATRGLVVGHDADGMVRVRSGNGEVTSTPWRLAAVKPAAAPPRPAPVQEAQADLFAAPKKPAPAQQALAFVRQAEQLDFAALLRR